MSHHRRLVVPSASYDPKFLPPREAANDEASGMRCRGRRLLVGDDEVAADPAKGIALLQEAAQSGDAEAYNLLATLAAAGAWMPQSWPRALDLLQKAAEFGSDDAREQLILLAQDGAKTPDWRALRRSIDLERFVVPPQPRQISDAPRIWRAGGFATPALCDRLIARARDNLRPAKMYHRGRGTVQFDAMRTNSEFVFDITHSGVVLVLMRIRIGLLVSLPPPHMEPPQILHYAPGQELRAHFDFLRGDRAGLGRDGSYRGDRLVTFLLYLNDDYEGGETEFLKTGLRHRGRKGDAIFFANLKDGAPDPMSLHRGNPPTRGEKWLFSQWIHDRPFTA
jgi:prolyl 4-hydroxylase